MNNYSINRFFYIINYEIVDGWKHYWNYYGPDAWVISNAKEDSCSCFTEYEVQAVFDTKTLVIYEVASFDYIKDICYRWIHPSYLDKVNEDAIKRNVDNSVAYGDFSDIVKFTDVSSFEEWESKTREIIDNYA